MKHPTRWLDRWRRFVAVLAFAFGLAGRTIGCGVDWRLPTNHFNGVDEQGHLSYWEKIGAVDCGDGLVLPLHLNFNSKRDAGAPSPYLGQGWLLPLLESKFVQESEDRFVMIQPDGLSNLFLRRGGPEGGVLEGSAGWKGEIAGETITAWASCGWKLVFAHGHIVSMSTPKGRKLDYIYEGGRVTELREGNVTRLRMEYNAQGEAVGLALGDGKHIGLAQDKKPRVQSIGGQNVIAGVDSSLSKVTLSDGQIHRYEFGTSDANLPTLNISSVSSVDSLVANNRASSVTPLNRFIWNAANGFLVRDGTWLYQVSPDSTMGANAAIARKSESGLSQYWKYDGVKGQEVTIDSDGIKHTKSWFVSGVLAGHVRSQLQELNGQVIKSRKWNYDDKGQLFRIIGPGNEITSYVRNDSGLLESIVTKIGDTVIGLQKFDAKGRLIQNGNEASNTTVYVYKDDNGSWPLAVAGIVEKLKPFIREQENTIDRIETKQGKEGASYLFTDEHKKKVAFVDTKGNIEQPNATNGSNATLINGKLGSSWEYFPNGKRKEQRYYAPDGLTLTKRVVFQYPTPRTIVLVTQYPAKQNQIETTITLNEVGRVVGQSVTRNQFLNPPLQ